MVMVRGGSQGAVLKERSSVLAGKAFVDLSANRLLLRMVNLKLTTFF